MKHISIIALVLVGLSVVSARNVTFGINLAGNSPLASWYQYTDHQALIGYEVWRDWWNALPVDARTTAWGEVITVNLHIESYSDYTGTPASKAGLFSVYESMAQNQSIDYLFGTVGFAGIELRQHMYDFGVPLMVFAADSSDQFYSIPGSFGSATANMLTMTSWLPYLRVAKASTIAVIYINDKVYESELCQGVVAQASYNNLKVVAQYGDMPFDWKTFGEINGNDTRIAIWNEVLDSIIALNPDALAICDYGAGAEYALNYFRSKNWIASSIAVAPLFRQFADPSVLDYVVSPQAYSPKATYPPQLNFTDSAGYNNLVLAKYGVPATSIMAQATLSGMLYTNALVNAASNSTDHIIIAMQTQQLQSFMGTSAVDGRRRQTLLSLLTQYMNSTNQIDIVGPAQAAADTFIYPMPKWSERKYAPRWGNNVEIAAVVLIAVGVLISIAALVFVIVNRTERVIYASSPLFCCLVIVGTILAYSSLIVWMPNLVSTTTCNLRVWLLPFGFTLIFGSLFSKTYRIHRMFTLDTLKTIIIRDWKVAIIVLMFMLGQTSISVFMTALTPIQSVVHVVDPYRPSLNYKACTFPATTKAFMYVNVVAAVALLGWGSYLIFHIRKIPFAIYDESKVIGFSIYNSFFFSLIILMVKLTIDNKYRNLTFMIMTACTFLACIITLGCIIGTKVYAMYMSSSATTSSGARSTTTHARNYSSGTSVSEKMQSVNDNTDPEILKDMIDAKELELKILRKKYAATQKSPPESK